MAKVTVLLEGYSLDQPDESVVCDSNVTLIAAKPIHPPGDLGWHLIKIP